MSFLFTRPVLLRACRAGVLFAAVWLVHRQAEWRASQRPSSISLRQAQKFFPTADRVQLRDPEQGVQIVLNARRETIGALMKTLPFTENVIGYAGPSDVLIALNTRGAVAGVEFLHSSDTAEHVRKVRNAEGFLSAFTGWRPDESPAPKVDAVSGATLTSLAVVESIQQRLAGATPSLRFPDPVTLGEVQAVFSNATRITTANRRWQVLDASGQALGSVLRTSPQADHVPGYRGPTDTLVALGPDGRTIIALRQRKTYETESYAAQVWRSEAFLNLILGQSISSMAQFEYPQQAVDGVSGATLTARAVAEGIRRRAQAELRAQAPEPFWRFSSRDWGLLAVIAGGALLSFTSLRGFRWVRAAWQLVLVGYVGFVNHDFVSLALVGGWTGNGAPIKTAPALVLLVSATFLVPWITRRQIYCHQLCPHGAAQQLLGGIGSRVRRVAASLMPGLLRRAQLPRRSTRPHSLVHALRMIPVFVLAAGLLFLLLGQENMLTSLEPFDGWSWRSAGLATLLIAGAGLAASIFIPQAYCRYGCPTGALLRFVRSSGSADTWGRRDSLALGLLVLGGLTVVGTRAFPPREPEPVPFECRGRALGAEWSVKIRDDIADPAAIEKVIARQFEWAESMTSQVQTNTGIWEFNHTVSTNPIPVPWPVITLSRLAVEISEKTGGAYDITSAPLARVWGLESGTTRSSAPSSAALQAARAAVGWQRLEIGDGVLRKQHPELELDLSTLARGWAVDQVWQILERRGYTNSLIALGSTVRAQGRWTLSLDSPRASCILTNEAVAVAYAASLPDPRTGGPPDHDTLSASVIHTNAAHAQAWAAAFAAMGADAAVPLVGRFHIAARFVTGRRAGQQEVRETGAWRAR